MVDKVIVIHCVTYCEPCGKKSLFDVNRKVRKESDAADARVAKVLHDGYGCTRNS